MTAATAAAASVPAAGTPAPECSVAPDTLVLPARITDGRGGDGPRFADDVWDVTAFVPWTTQGSRIDFAAITDPGQRRTAKEFLHSRINRAVPVGGTTAKPMKITNLLGEFREVRAILADLAAAGAPRLADVTPALLAGVLSGWRTTSAVAAAGKAGVVRHMAAHGPFLTDKLTFMPWLGRTANQVAGRIPPQENTTPRIPEDVIAPLLKAAVFYVQTAAGDLLAARAELAGLHAATAGMARLTSGQARARLEAFVQARSQEGRGMPAQQSARRRGAAAEPNAHLPARRHPEQRRLPPRVPRRRRTADRVRRRRPELAPVAMAGNRAALATRPGREQPRPGTAPPAHRMLDRHRLPVGHARPGGTGTRPGVRVHRTRRRRPHPPQAARPRVQGPQAIRRPGRLGGSRDRPRRRRRATAGQQPPDPPVRLGQGRQGRTHARRPRQGQPVRRPLQHAVVRTRPPVHSRCRRQPVGLRCPPVPQEPGLAHRPPAVRRRRRRPPVPARQGHRVRRLRRDILIRIRRRSRSRAEHRPAGLSREPVPGLEHRRAGRRRCSPPDRRRVLQDPRRPRRPARHHRLPGPAAHHAAAPVHHAAPRHTRRLLLPARHRCLPQTRRATRNRTAAADAELLPVVPERSAARPHTSPASSRHATRHARSSRTPAAGRCPRCNAPP